jgi:hypothetical protein
MRVAGAVMGSSRDTVGRCPFKTRQLSAQATRPARMSNLHHAIRDAIAIRPSQPNIRTRPNTDTHHRPYITLVF